MAKISRAERTLPDVCGGDGTNYWYFYSGSSYPNNSRESIAAYAKEHFEPFKDMDVDMIANDHMYWGTDACNFKGCYNGDTNILFGDADKLPEALREDAYRYVSSLREKASSKVQSFVKDDKPARLGLPDIEDVSDSFFDFDFK